MHLHVRDLPPPQPSKTCQQRPPWRGAATGNSSPWARVVLASALSLLLAGTAAYGCAKEQRGADEEKEHAQHAPDGELLEGQAAFRVEGMKTVRGTL